MERILVIGGGFAGLHAALAAVRVSDGKAEVTLVSREPWLTIRPRLYEADPESLKADLAAPLRTVGARFVLGEAARLDVAARSVALADGSALAFGRLVLATGSVMRRPDVPDADKAYSIDDRASAVAFDARLKQLSGARAPVLAVVGAGFTGIELALELRNRLAVHGGDAEGARIHLIDRAAEIGADLGPGPRPAILAAVSAARSETRLGARIAGLSATQIDFADGSRLDADAVVLCTGLAASGLAAQVPGEKDATGRIVPDAYLRAPAAPLVFCAGDTVRGRTDDAGHVSLFSCQHALRLGKVAGENAARDLLGLPLVPYRQERYVTCLDLGRAGAVTTTGWERAIQKTGAEAKAVKTMINRQLIYPPTGTRAEILAASEIDLPSPSARAGAA